jgi:hypothetical protein
VAATLSSNSPICSGADAIFTITGTAGNTVNIQVQHLEQQLLVQVELLMLL